MPVKAPLWVAIPVLLLAVVAAWEDTRTRRISNVITGPAFLLGIGAHLLRGWMVHRGWGDGLLALAGAVIAGAMLLPGWLAKWMGAGDVKLMAAVGAWLGFPLSFYAVLFTLVAGGAIAVVVALRRGILVRSLRGAALLIPGLAARIGRPRPPREEPGFYVPFAFAILVGSLFALWRPV